MVYLSAPVEHVSIVGRANHPVFLFKVKLKLKTNTPNIKGWCQTNGHMITEKLQNIIVQTYS